MEVEKVTVEENKFKYSKDKTDAEKAGQLTQCLREQDCIVNKEMLHCRDKRSATYLRSQ